MMLFKDQLRREISLPQTPQRIISLVPSQTELLCDLGLEKFLVGVTKFCVHPKHLRQNIDVVGGTKKVNVSRIKDLRPDLVICNKEENTLEIVKALQDAAAVWVSDISTIDDSLDMIKSLGELFSVSDKASELFRAITAEKKAFQNFIKDQPPKKVAYLIWKNPFMAAGKNTFIDELLSLNKFENVILKDRYPEITLEELNEADLVLLSSEPYPFKEKDAQEMQQLVKSKVIIVDGEYFSWYGSRLLKAFSYFRSLH